MKKVLILVLFSLVMISVSGVNLRHRLTFKNRAHAKQDQSTDIKTVFRTALNRLGATESVVALNAARRLINSGSDHKAEYYVNNPSTLRPNTLNKAEFPDQANKFLKEFQIDGAFNADALNNLFATYDADADVLINQGEFSQMIRDVVVSAIEVLA